MGQKKVLYHFLYGILLSTRLFGDVESTNNPIIHLGPYLNQNTFDCIREIGCQPIFIDISKESIQKVYDSSDECFLNGFEEMRHLLKKWEKEFTYSKAAQPWMNVRFGMRDKRGEQQRHKDQKFYLQFCKEFGEWVLENRSEEISRIPPLESLFFQLLTIEEKCQKVFMSKATELLAKHPKAESLFYNYKGKKRVPISMRIISYESEGDLSVSPHYDKAAMTILLMSDDDPKKECLVVAPAEGKEFDPTLLKRPIRPEPLDPQSESCALFITGSMLEYIGVPVPPTPHAVLPHDRKLRHVLVAFCNVPNLDTSHLKYSIVYKKELPENFEKRFE